MTLVLSALCGVLLPGLALASLGLSGGRSVDARPGSFLAQTATFGVGTWLMAGGLLEATVGITRTSSLTMVAVLATASVVILALRATRLRRAALDLLHGLGVSALAIAVWLPVLLANRASPWAPIGSTPWFYWGLAADVAREHRVPAESVEWGVAVPFLDDYHLFTTATASLLSQEPGTASLHTVMLIATLQLGLGSSLLVMALGGGRVASLLAVPFAVGTGIGLVKLSGYRPEAFGIGLALLAVACFVYWLRDHRLSALGAATIGAAALSQVHGISFTVAGALFLAAVLAFAPGKPELWGYLRRVGAAALLLVVAGLVVRFTIGGAMTAATEGELADIGGVADPTWDFVRALRGLPPSTPPSNAELVEDALVRSYPGGANGWWILALAGLALVVLVVASVRRHEPRPALFFFGAGLVGLTGVVLVFLLAWEGYVPRRTGGHRVVQEMTLLVGPMIAYAVHVVQGMTNLRRPWLPAAVVTAAGTAVAVVASSSFAALVGDRRPTLEHMSELEASVQPVPGKFVLTNGYTEGYVRMTTGAAALLEGRAPYTFPDLLDRSIRLLRESQRFLAEPSTDPDFLDRNQISHVVVARRGSLATAGSTFRVDRGALVDSSRLRVEMRTPDLLVLRVVPGSP